MEHGGFITATDATGRADVGFATATWAEVVRRYAALGIRLRRPVALVIEAMPIMGATQTTRDGHRLHVAAHALRSGALDGLMAHELGHMVRTEQGHPSHRPEVHRRAVEAVPVPPGQRRAFGGVVRTAINHVEDIYADDLAFQVIRDDDGMAAFFSDWARNSAQPGPTRWATVGQAVTVAFALGNLARHGIRPEDGVDRRTEAFARTARVDALPQFVAVFRDLPRTDGTEPVEAAIRDLLSAIASEAFRGRGT